MANFKSLTSTVCGASTLLNNMLNDADAFADGLLDGLEEGLKPAAELIAEGQEIFDKAEATLKGLVPKLPTLKSLGLQDEVDALKLLAGDAIAYADKVASIAAAFGNLDFEKIMEATCEAENKKIIDGKAVTVAKNVTMQEGSGTIEAYIAVDNPFAAKTGADLVTEKTEKTYTESKAKIIEESAEAERKTRVTVLEKAGYTLTKPEGTSLTDNAITRYFTED